MKGPPFGYSLTFTRADHIGARQRAGSRVGRCVIAESERDGRGANGSLGESLSAHSQPSVTSVAAEPTAVCGDVPGLLVPARGA